MENGITDTYTYDAIDQITGVSYSTNRTVSYGYDALGSRTNVTDNIPQSRDYTANNLNQYTTVGGASLVYDAKGNLTTGPGSASYTYEGNNRLTSATVGTNSATFTHDARMRNIKRVVNGQTRYFYFDDWSLVQERDGSGNVVQNYVNGPRIDEVIRKTDTSGTVYYHADALGSVVALTDHTGGVVERYTYDVFGAPAIFDGAGSGISATAHDNRHLFTGREWIEEVGLYDYRNRIYSPALGRFLQTDPIRFEAGDANLYRYVANNPANWIDPLGLFLTGCQKDPCEPLRARYRRLVSEHDRILDKLEKEVAAYSDCLNGCPDGPVNPVTGRPTKDAECVQMCRDRHRPTIDGYQSEGASKWEEVVSHVEEMQASGCWP